MQFIQGIIKGIDLGIKVRKYATHLRLNNIDPWETVNPNSPEYTTSKDFQKKIGKMKYLGLIIGQLLEPREWYANAEYLFGDNSHNDVDSLLLVYIKNDSQKPDAQ